MVNRAAGKGYENEGYYSNIQFKFCPIENIHAMRSSLQKLLESTYQHLSNQIERVFFFFSLACELKNPTMNQYLYGLENSSWLQHIKSLLDTAVFIARVSRFENIVDEFLRLIFFLGD